MSDQEKETLMDSNYKKLAQLSCIRKYMKKKQELVEDIIKNDYNINYQIPANNFFKSKKPQWIGKTSLHIALEKDDIDVFNILMQCGADFTIKDNNGNTVLHQAVENLFKSTNSCWYIKQRHDCSFIKSILSAHVSSQISTNPTNNYGLSHFHIACIMNDVKLTEFFLKNGVSVSDAVSAKSPNFPGYTPLHFAVKYYSVEVVEILLKIGANVDLTDSNGLSPLHLIIKIVMEIIIHKGNHSDWFFNETENELETNERMINVILTNHSADQWNFTDSIGMTRFHVALTLQSTLLTKKAIKEGADLRLAINADSPFLPGYTALHIAAHFNSDNVKILLENGGNLTVKDAKGDTPFDICIRRWDGDFFNHLIQSQSEWKDIMFSDNRTYLTDFSYCMEDKKMKNFLKYRIGVDDINSSLPINSPLWPGYTFLHLTVVFIGKIYIEESDDDFYSRVDWSDHDDDEEYRNIRIMKACLRLGADVTIQNVNGSTPLHLAFRMNQQIAVNELLKFHGNDKIVNPVDKDGLTHLHVACAAKIDDEEDDIENEEGEMVEIGENLVKNLLQNGINPNCSVTSGIEWKNQYDVKIFINVGWTPLHVAVASYNVRTIKILMEHGADIYAKDVNGLTPIHLILSSPYCYKEMGDFLLSTENLKNNIATCGLSHLHIACYVKNVQAIKKLLENGANKETVISYKVPQNCKHKDELTIDDEEYGTDADSYRSVKYCDSCATSHEPLSFLGPFAGYTPLHMALMRNCKQEIIRLLVEHGVDVHTKRPDGTFPFYRVLDRDVHRNKPSIIPVLKSNETLQKYIEEKTGITMLHVNCAILDVDAVVELLNNGADVNSKVHANSPLWPDCTPLHLLSSHYDLMKTNSLVFDSFNRIAGLLLENGADVVCVNSRQNSPIHEAFRRIFRLSVFTQEDDDSARNSSVALLMKAQTDFSVNPTDVTGVSHFHIACICGNLTAVQEFLKHGGVDINSPVDYFFNSYSDGGLTPFHFAIIGQSKEVVDLLLKLGADPNVTDHEGNTSLHFAVKFNLTNEDVFKSLISAGADLLIENVYGATPINLLFEEKQHSKTLEIFLKHGVRVNVFDDQTGEGYIASKVLKISRDGILQEPIFKAPIFNTKVNDDDEMNRSPIHNIVSTDKVYISNDDYVKAIEEYVKAGFDLDRRDKKGRTALHLAIEFKNVDGITALLSNGADINIVDDDFNTPYAYCFQFKQTNRRLEYDVFKILTLHIHKLQTFGLHVNQINKICDQTIGDQFPPVQKRWYNREVPELLKKKIHDSSLIVLFDFLSETNAVAAYPLMPRILRDEIDIFFQNNGNHLCTNFPTLVGLLKLQYRKAKIRITMIESAKASLDFISKIEIPDLCSDVIIRLLTNEDLKNLIKSASAEWQSHKRIRLN